MSDKPTLVTQITFAIFAIAAVIALKNQAYELGYVLALLSGAAAGLIFFTALPYQHDDGSWKYSIDEATRRKRRTVLNVVSTIVLSISGAFSVLFVLNRTEDQSALLVFAIIIYPFAMLRLVYFFYVKESSPISMISMMVMYAGLAVFIGVIVLLSQVAAGLIVVALIVMCLSVIAAGFAIGLTYKKRVRK